MRFADNRALFDATAEEYGVAPEDRFLPMVVVDGKTYVGNSKLESAMPLDFIENESTDSLIYYLYSPACESCAAAEKAIDALPEKLTVTRGRVEFESAMVVERINIYENPSAAQSLFQRYRVPEDKQTTPIVFLRDDYVGGAEQIEKRLPYMLSAGLALNTPKIAAPEVADSQSALSVAGTAAAGLVAGFNPCALSMLLLFLSIMLSSGERAVRYAVVYLAAKFAAYVAIGTVFLSVFSAWNPIWLPTAARLLLTAIGGVLIVLNVMDAWAARHEQYGRIKNQLPGRIRGFLNRRIKESLHGKGIMLALSVALLGVVVAASEFLCSGQLYLANMIAGFSGGAAYARQLMLLLVFCAAFLLPSAVITAIVVKSRNMFGVSNTILKHMPLIKLATAAAMLLIIVAAWVVAM
ncbi:MAG: hypothetical protein IJ048_11220 [Clostridia bacterium]|nr:hypothetical protein [Clostridia bacterium]